MERFNIGDSAEDDENGEDSGLFPVGDEGEEDTWLERSLLSDNLQRRMRRFLG